MKKTLFLMAASLLMALASSCGSKTCVCYEPVNGVMTMQDVLYPDGTRCKDQSTSRRTCVEEAERLDPSQMAVDFKK